MWIDPFSQAELLLAAFMAGIAMGVFSECGRILRVLLGGDTPPESMRSVYAAPLPIIHVAVQIRRKRASGGIKKKVVSFCLDAGFCLLFGIVGILVQYRYHDGAFRLMLPLGMLTGFFLWRYFVSRYTARLVAWLAYLLRALWCYLRALLLYPVRLVCFRVVMPIVGRGRAFASRLRQRREQRISEALCREQFIAASIGFATGRHSHRPLKQKRKQYYGKKK